jgi:hypothetical protein
MPITELRRKIRVKPESAWLRDFAANVTSQSGEDGMIAKIFDTIGAVNRWCVEFGAWDGKYLSNTWDLRHNKGWRSVLIEGDPVRAAALAAENQEQNSAATVVQAHVGWAGENALDTILAGSELPANFDLLSIDIDGNDWHVWRALTHYRPRLVVVEFNPSASNDFYFVQDADPAINQGASLLAFCGLAREKGYELAATTAANAFFVLTEEFPKLGIADNSPDAIHAPQSTTELCQGFDGTIFAAGHMMLTWHGIQLDQEDFQVLPRHLRKYPDPG